MESPSVIIVEDEAIVAIELEENLESLGYSVLDSVTSGEEAIERTRNLQPDLVLMDIRLDGDMDGIEAASNIRRHFDIPVVYLTAYTDDRTLERAKMSQPFGYLVKPFSRRELRPAIETALFKHSMESELRESRQRLALALSGADMGLWDWNIGTGELFSYRIPAETEDQLIQDFRGTFEMWETSVHPEDLPVVKRALSEHLEGRSRICSLEYRFLTPSGDWRWVLSRGKVVNRDRDGNPVRFTGTLVDITERKASEEAIRISEEKFRVLFDHAPVGIVLVDKEGRALEMNQALVQILRAADVRIERSVEFLQSPLLVAQGVTEAFKECMDKGEIVGKEIRLQEKAKEAFYCSLLLTPIRNPDGTVRGCQAVIQDISEHKRAQQLLLENTRIKALGEMSAGVSHNFNNLLQIVMSGAQLALANLESNDRLQVELALREILKNSQLGAETIKRLQQFTRPKVGERVHSGKAFDLSQVVDQAVEMTKPYWKTNPQRSGITVALSRELQPGCIVLGNENELFEVAVNLLKNAVEALPEGGEITVRTSADADNVVLEVRDTGVGIPRHDLSKVFEPFWTTKGFHGTGMGLASCNSIVRRRGGDITAKSSPGEGTVFTVKLPLAKALPGEPQPSPISAPPFRCRMLLIDDSPPLLNLLALGLRKLGHEVFTADSGVHGLKVFNQTHPDVVVCDLAMPDLNGRQVAERMRDLRARDHLPKTPFILITGWGVRPDDHEKGIQCGIDRIIEKPVSLRDLAETVRGLVQ